MKLQSRLSSLQSFEQVLLVNKTLDKIIDIPEYGVQTDKKKYTIFSCFQSDLKFSDMPKNTVYLSAILFVPYLYSPGFTHGKYYFSFIFGKAGSITIAFNIR